MRYFAFFAAYAAAVFLWNFAARKYLLFHEKK